MLVLALLAPIQQMDEGIRDAVQAHRVGWLEQPMRTARFGGSQK